MPDPTDRLEQIRARLAALQKQHMAGCYPLMDEDMAFLLTQLATARQELQAQKELTHTATKTLKGQWEYQEARAAKAEASLTLAAQVVEKADALRLHDLNCDRCGEALKTTDCDHRGMLAKELGEDVTAYRAHGAG